MNLPTLSSLFPSEDKFYHMLDELAAKANHSSHLLKVLIEREDKDTLAEVSADIARTKTEAKRLMETMTSEVCRTFITPFDREDIQAFAVDLYKISKLIEKINQRLIIHRLRPVEEDLNLQLNVILQESNLLVQIVKELSNGRNSKSIQEKTSQMHELEEQGDELLNTLIARLFDRTSDARELMMRKDVYVMLEQVIDYYRDAANVALQIILKHS